jgi:segregation and condensation protein B
VSETQTIPELKQIVGAMIFGSNRALTVREMQKCLAETAEVWGEETTAFGKVTESQVRAAVEELAADMKHARCGIVVSHVAGGVRFQSDAACGKWLKELLSVGRPNRLSRPSLETLAIIAYRQPVSRADIEAIRGVAVDHVLKTLLEMQFVRITGRSDLPGRPFLYGTTQRFLEHFGLKNVEDLDKLGPLLEASSARGDEARAAAGPAAETPGHEDTDGERSLR